MNQNQWHRIGNIIGLLLISAVLTIAFLDQLNHHDLPCPLCLLQRISFVAMGICLCMNLKIGIKTSHYGLMLLAAGLGFGAALRQIFLHLTPGDPGYGHLFWGLDLYIWSLIAFAIAIALIAIGLLFEKGFTHAPPKTSRMAYILMVFFLFLILLNVISTFIECGMLVCEDNPTEYYLLQSRTLNNTTQE